MTKPLELKSPDNAMALAVYLLTVVLGAAFAIGSASSAGMTILLGMFVPVWGLAMMVFGLGGFTSAVTCPHSYRPGVWLKVEQVASLGFAGVWAVYAVGSQMNPGATKVGLILFGLMAVAGLWRSAQLFIELLRLRQATAKPVTVTAELLADPRDDV